MTKYYLAVDIGASGGRHILAHLENRVLVTETVYRFENYMDKIGGSLYWDTERLFSEVLEGMRKCALLGKIPSFMGIDTWGVDYALLDKNGNLLDRVYAYRDHRTDDTDRELERIISLAELYQNTGIQKQKFNTVYQLFEDKKSRTEIYEKADKMLLLPDYLAYRLTGNVSTEYTNATTTGLINAGSGDWDYKLIERLDLNISLFTEIIDPGSNVGRLKEDIAKKVGFNTEYIKVASHDTASAVAAVPTDKETIFISSGTWSLLGTERMAPDCSANAQKENFTNEGGVERRYRFLKNIMGMWMIQSIRHEYGDAYDYKMIAESAQEYDLRRKCTKEELYDQVIDVNNSEFLSPESMREVIDKACIRRELPVPDSIGAYASLIYRSLASNYRNAIKGLEEITGTSYETIHIVGGGSQADYLNELIEEYTGKKVCKGPIEATAIGNIYVQLISDGIYKDINEARIKTIINENNRPVKEYKGD